MGKCERRKESCERFVVGSGNQCSDSYFSLSLIRLQIQVFSLVLVLITKSKKG